MMQGVSVEIAEKGLYLTTPSAGGCTGRHYFNYWWLRDNCPSSFSTVSADRAFDITTLAAGVRAAAAGVEGGSLIIDWAADGHRSRYDLHWLIAWAESPGHDDPANLPQRLWRSDHGTLPARFEFDAIRQDLPTRLAYFETILRDGLGLVDGMPDTPEGITELAEIAGHVRATFSGVYFNVKAYPDPAGAAYSAAALEPHTDNPCETYPPGIQYLHCRINNATGGESTFADGAAVAADLKASWPEAYHLLATQEIPFRFSHELMDMRARQRVILADEAGRVSGVTVSQHMADVFDLDQGLLDDYYPAFQHFLKMLRDPAYEISFGLKAGQCVVFDNQRTVHGRRTFDPQSGARLLRGCYTDRGELRSRYRVLVRDGRITTKRPQGAD